VAELHSNSRNQLTQLTGGSAVYLFFLFHAVFEDTNMFKKIAIFSLVMVIATAEFRFGGVSVIPSRETRFGKNIFHHIWPNFFLLNSMPIWSPF
jgi:hypothetical protein